MKGKTEIQDVTWVGLLGNDEGGVVLTVDTDKFHAFALSTNQVRFLYALLGGFCS